MTDETPRRRYRSPLDELEDLMAAQKKGHVSPTQRPPETPQSDRDAAPVGENIPPPREAKEEPQEDEPQASEWAEKAEEAEEAERAADLWPFETPTTESEASASPPAPISTTRSAQLEDLFAQTLDSESSRVGDSPSEALLTDDIETAVPAVPEATAAEPDAPEPLVQDQAAQEPAAQDLAAQDLAAQDLAAQDLAVSPPSAAETDAVELPGSEPTLLEPVLSKPAVASEALASGSERKTQTLAATLASVKGDRGRAAQAALSRKLSRAETLPGLEELLIRFRAGGIAFAVPMAQIAEIGERPALTRIPGLPAAFPGVANLQGEVVLALDLPIILQPQLPGKARHSLLIHNRDRELMGLVLIDEVHGIAPFDREGMSTSTSQGSNALSAHEQGGLEFQGRSYAVVNLLAWLQSDEISAQLETQR